jgi:hypothetical protein
LCTWYWPQWFLFSILLEPIIDMFLLDRALGILAKDTRKKAQ